MGACIISNCHPFLFDEPLEIIDVALVVGLKEGDNVSSFVCSSVAMLLLEEGLVVGLKVGNNASSAVNWL